MCVSKFSGNHSDWEFGSNKFLARAGRMDYKSILIGDPIAKSVPDKRTYLEYKEDVKQSADGIGVDALEVDTKTSTPSVANAKKKKSGETRDSETSSVTTDFFEGGTTSVLAPMNPTKMSGIKKKRKQALIKLYQLNTLVYEELTFFISLDTSRRKVASTIIINAKSPKFPE